jgi:hypothetical protein
MSDLLRTILDTAIRPAHALLPEPMDSTRALVMEFATGLQESRLTHRRQLVGDPPRPTGPAKGLWQFERGGGCRGVVEHQASRYWMQRVCVARGAAFTASGVWNAIETDDVLAAAAARLLLFTDPRKLPDVDDERGAWNLYLRVWRPGKPHPKTWPAFHRQAREFVAETAGAIA